MPRILLRGSQAPPPLQRRPASRSRTRFSSARGSWLGWGLRRRGPPPQRPHHHPRRRSARLAAAIALHSQRARPPPLRAALPRPLRATPASASKARGGHNRTIWRVRLSRTRPATWAKHRALSLVSPRRQENRHPYPRLLQVVRGHEHEVQADRRGDVLESLPARPAHMRSRRRWFTRREESRTPTQLTEQSAQARAREEIFTRWLRRLRRQWHGGGSYIVVCVSVRQLHSREWQGKAVQVEMVDAVEGRHMVSESHLAPCG